MKMTCLLEGCDSIPIMFRPFALKMEEVGMPAIVINVFKCYYAQLEYGAQGVLSENEILPVAPKEVKNYEDLESYAKAGQKVMGQAVVIKLNGGLGTTMGLESPKSLIPVYQGLTFLDMILRQIRVLRKRFNVPLPLLLMNSFKTHAGTMGSIDGFDNGDTNIPLAFVQHRFPKILDADHTPAKWPKNPELEWNPPGHGDIYTALLTSGLLVGLLEKGYRYAFISNSDNLGAVMDERLLGFLAKKKLPFVMEVSQRTQTDRKGGHLTKLLKNNRFALREVAQCSPQDMASFMDIKKHRYFNTNSLWVNLEAVEQIFMEHLTMPLDLIFNTKRLDPRDSSSPEVIQIETAMGSAISAFADASAVLIPRTRFAPVKTTNDLLLVMSDVYRKTDDETLIPIPKRMGTLPPIDLDPAYYRKIDDFLHRFPKGAPSLKDCSSLKVEGDVLFEDRIIAKGQVLIRNPKKKQIRIPAGTLLSGEHTFG